MQCLCYILIFSSYFFFSRIRKSDRKVEARGNKIPGVILHRCTATRGSLCKNHFLPKVIYPSSRGLFAWGYLHLWRPVISGYHLGASRIYFSFCLPSAAVSFPGGREARRIFESKHEASGRKVFTSRVHVWDFWCDLVKFTNLVMRTACWYRPFLNPFNFIFS